MPPKRRRRQIDLQHAQSLIQEFFCIAIAYERVNRLCQEKGQNVVCFALLPV
jgi:hypothetical protein